MPSRPDDPLLEGWYHTIELGGGLISKGYFDHRSIVDKYGLPTSLRGKTALDVGTGDGFFAFEMERRGADKVVAIDVDRLGDCDWLPRMRTRLDGAMESTTWRDHFRMAHSLLGSKVERIVCSVYDLSPERVGIFDVVFCGDLLLHLQNPLRALQNIRSVTRETAIVETIVAKDLEDGFPDLPYLKFGARDSEAEAGGLNTFWQVTTKALEDMLIYADFQETHPQGRFSLPPLDIPVTSVVAR